LHVTAVFAALTFESSEERQRLARSEWRVALDPVQRRRVKRAALDAHLFDRSFRAVQQESQGAGIG
jgi:hypothetical protein